MPFPNPPAKIVPFDSGPVAPHDIGRQFDEHAKSVSNVIDFLRTVVRDDGIVRNGAIGPEQLTPALKDSIRSTPLPTSPALGPGAGGFYAGDVEGATATAADYAQVAIEWAEHMPDTIPPNILAVNAITGDHWSSRWWANYAAQLVQQAANAPITGVVPAAQRLAITVQNVIPALLNPPFGLVTLFYNGMTFTSLDLPTPFTVSGNTLTWTSSIYTLLPGSNIVVSYNHT